MKHDRFREIKLKHTKNGLPFFVMDNFFNQNEVHEMLDELDFMRKSFRTPEDTYGAKDNDGEYIKKNMGIMHHEFYHSPNLSPIYRITRQYFDSELLDPMKEQAWFLRYIDPELGAFDSLQMLYYENSDKYDAHKDAAVATFLCWLYREPKSFSGGDLIIEHDAKIECKSNRVVVFPSIAWHQVTELSMSEDALDGYGRYCISNFLHIKAL